MSTRKSPEALETFAPDGTLQVIIETPKGSRNKFDFDPQNELFKLGGVMPLGAVFPFDFGFAPSTRGEDGDPLDVLVLMDAPAFSGCLVPCRLIGVVEARQTERDGAQMRNDRLIAVADNSHAQRTIQDLPDLSADLLDEIEYFFVSYNTFKGKSFEILNRGDTTRAAQLIVEGQTRYQSAIKGAKSRISSTRSSTKSPKTKTK